MAQILCRTHLSNDTPRINSENLLVLATPLVFIFGAAIVCLLVYVSNFRPTRGATRSTPGSPS